MACMVRISGVACAHEQTHITSMSSKSEASQTAIGMQPILDDDGVVPISLLLLIFESMLSPSHTFITVYADAQDRLPCQDQPCLASTWAGKASQS